MICGISEWISRCEGDAGLKPYRTVGLYSTQYLRLYSCTSTSYDTRTDTLKGGAGRPVSFAYTAIVG